MLWKASYLFLLSLLAANAQQQQRHRRNNADTVLLSHPKYLPETIVREGNASATSTASSDEFIIRLADNTNDLLAAIDQLMKTSFSDGAVVTHTYNHIFKGLAISKITSFRLVQMLDKPIVTYATPNNRAFASQSEIITQTDATWGLDRLSSPGGDGEYKYRYDGSGVNAYVLDTGIRMTHVDFNDRVTCGQDYYGESCEDVYGHGTHVAGTIGGITYGVAKNVNLIAVKVLDDSGSGTWANVIAGIDWVVGQKKSSLATTPMVINMSLGGGYIKAVNDAVKAAHVSGIVVVVAAGNSNGANSCDYSPASALSAITVASSDSFDYLSYFSNVGSCVDLVAPGEGITSAWIGSDTDTNTISGTSMAAPHVAGVAALIMQRQNTIKPKDVAWRIQADGLKGVVINPWTPGSFKNILLNVRRRILKTP